MPVVKTIGKKTHTVVSVEATIAPRTCLAPCTAARGAAMPRLRMRMIFSMTTMLLSTSMPMPRARPESVIMLRDRSVKYISTREKSTESGMLTPTMTVGRTSRRKSASTRMASSAPRAMLLTMLLTISVIYLPWSTSLIRCSCGSSVCSFSIAFVQLRDTSFVPEVEPL